MFIHQAMASPIILLGLLLGNLAILSPAVFAQVCGEPNSIFPNPPQTSRTEGHRQQLITRGEDTCPSPVHPLTALTSPQASDNTFSAYPSFWFFVPFHQQQLEKLEFLLYDHSETELIYSTQVPVPSSPGLIEVKLPEQVEYALRENQQYRWYFLLDCKHSRSRQPDLEVNGWITRRPLTGIISQKIHSQPILSTYLAYQDAGAWYDAVSYSAAMIRANPQDATAQTLWENLLACLQLQWVVQAEFVEAKATRKLEPQVLSE